MKALLAEVRDTKKRIRVKKKNDLCFFPLCPVSVI